MNPTEFDAVVAEAIAVAASFGTNQMRAGTRLAGFRAKIIEPIPPPRHLYSTIVELLQAATTNGSPVGISMHSRQWTAADEKQ